MLPSGDLAWVRFTGPDAESSLGGPGRAEDVALDIESLAPVKLPDFTETVRGVVDSVWQALNGREPDSVTVEFGIEIAAKTGRFISVLAEAGGAAHIKVTASWGQGAPRAGARQRAGEGAAE
jgi:hypothetical protein